MKIDSFVDVNIQLKTAAVPQPAYATELLLLDTEAVPIDRRIRVLVPGDEEDLTVGSVERDFATAYFGQAVVPDKLILGRQAKAAIPPAFVCETHDATVATWEAIDAGSFTVTDSSANSEVVSGLDFTGITTFQQALGVMNVALAALVAPSVVGLDNAEFALDALGRVVLTMPTGQDESDPTITIGFNAAAGTVPYLLGLKASGDGTSVAGNAIETRLTAYSAVKVKTEAFYNVALGDRLAGPTYTEEIALAAQVNTERRQLTYIDTNTDMLDPADFTDLHSQLKALSYDNTIVLYTDVSHGDYPDASADGAFFPATPGTKSYGHTPLSGCLPSGTNGEDYDLSSSDIAAIEAKGGNYIPRAGGYTFVHKGRTAGGKEKRLVLGAHWLEAAIQGDVFGLDMNQDLLSFDEFTLGAISGILEKWLDEAVDRRLITSYTLNIPDPADFSDAEIASGDMVLDKAFKAVGNFEAYTFQITGNIVLS